VKRRAIQSWLF